MIEIQSLPAIYAHPDDESYRAGGMPALLVGDFFISWHPGIAWQFTQATMHSFNPKIT